MEEEANSSWIRRTKFSHTVCHRLDSSKLASIPLTIERDQSSGLKSRAGSSNFTQTAEPKSSDQIRQRPAPSKQRSLSPLPQTSLSDAFKEAQSDQKRFSTPHPRREPHGKEIMGKLNSKKMHGSRKFNSTSSFTNLRQLGSMKFHDKTKSRKESSWTKYFDHGGGKVNSVETGDEWMVDLSKLFLGLRFACGAHSRLYHGVYKDEPVAVKIVRLPDDDDENEELAVRLENQFNREVSLLSRLRHSNIIKFVAAWRKPPVFCIITEYLSQGSLRAYLHKLEHKSLPLEKIVSIALDIARGMEFLHSQGVIHRDLKPENILIDQEFHMKIADYGIACEESYCDAMSDDPGTYRWMAPEMIKRKSYGRKVDVYSFGLILWELTVGHIPYEDMTPIQAAFAVMNKDLRPVIPGDCPPAMRTLIERCWCLQSEKRPEFWQIVKLLEQFESSLASDGTLSLVQNPMCQDHKKEKGALHWIQKLGPVHPNGSIVPKPKFI